MVGDQEGQEGSIGVCMYTRRADQVLAAFLGLWYGY